jgi:hypothetical protein
MVFLHRILALPVLLLAGIAQEGLDRCGVAEQVVRLPLAGVIANEPKVVVEAFDRSGRPIVEEAGLARLPLNRRRRS